MTTDNTTPPTPAPHDNEIVIKDWYAHEHGKSVFVMFDKRGTTHWCYSGNELRRIYLLDPSKWISEPLELPIPDYLDRKLTAMYNDEDNWFA